MIIVDVYDLAMLLQLVVSLGAIRGALFQNSLSPFLSFLSYHYHVIPYICISIIYNCKHYQNLLKNMK